MGHCGKGYPACEECTQKCLLIHHGKKDASPDVISFFKVMIGDRFSTVLFIPPKTARTMASLIDKETFLEDMKGRRWKVTLSTVDGSLAILQGWSEFAYAHSLRIGDFLVFYHVADSHFIVQIYGSSGSERLYVSEKRYNSRDKRTRTEHSLDRLPPVGTKASVSTIPSGMTGKDSVDGKGSNSTVQSDFGVKKHTGKADTYDVADLDMVLDMPPNGRNSGSTPQPVRQVVYDEVPFYMFGRNSPDKQGASGGSLFDLSNYEMPNVKLSATEKNLLGFSEKGKSPCHDVNSLDHQTISKNNGVKDQLQKIDKVPVGRDGENNGVSKDAQDAKMNKRKYYADHAEKIPLPTGESSHVNNILKQLPPKSNGALKRTPFTEELNRVSSGNDSVKIQRTHTRESGGRVAHNIYDQNPVNMQARDSQAGKVPVAVKKEQFDYAAAFNRVKVPVAVKKEQFGYAAAFNRGECPVIVKEEPEDNYGDEFGGPDSDMEAAQYSPRSIGFFCSAPAGAHSFLELPVNLPSFSSKGKRSKLQKKIVVFQDSAMRKWPIIYHERSAFRILASGWKALAEANNIQEGDICNLSVENQSESLIKIAIQRKDSSE